MKSSMKNEHLREEPRSSSGFGSFLFGAIIGSLVMYMLDPEQGKRRRALARDKVNKISNDVSRYGGKTARDLRNRAQGVVSEAKSTIQ